ncbi:MAG: hypothetical protein AAFO63_00290 [Pseudomonadota bacterium]
MTELIDTYNLPRPSVQWWPFRYGYMWRIRAYRAYTSGRCSPLALVEDDDGKYFEAIITGPAEHPDDTWTVRAVNRKGIPTYEVKARQIKEIQCDRFAAGYNC